MQTEMLALYKMSNAICFLIYNSLQNHVTLALHVMVARAWKVDGKEQVLSIKIPLKVIPNCCYVSVLVRNARVHGYV